ncbi:MAG: 50S ribosomal protein L19 [Chloroflexi bacterium]|nr:50S ribosomal protein L19 [Chloroflexota bacterium]
MDAAATLAPAAVRDSVHEFNVGDTVRVNVTIKEGDRTRVQAFQGIVIKGSYTRSTPPAPGATFIVRRVSYGIGVERTFLLCSPLLDSLDNLRRGRVAQGRLYYLRGLSGKRARIKEKRLVPGAPAVEEAEVMAAPQPTAETTAAPEAEPEAGQPAAPPAEDVPPAEAEPAAPASAMAEKASASGPAAPGA